MALCSYHVAFSDRSLNRYAHVRERIAERSVEPFKLFWPTYGLMIERREPVNLRMWSQEPGDRLFSLFIPQLLEPRANHFVSAQCHHPSPYDECSGIVPAEV